MTVKEFKLGNNFNLKSSLFVGVIFVYSTFSSILFNSSFFIFISVVSTIVSTTYLLIKKFCPNA